MTENKPESVGFFALLRNRRVLAVSLLGFASGLPLALTGATLQAWMKSENVDLSVIGLFSLVGLPYTLKFLWAPLMDRYLPPFMPASMGRRRGWILLCQLALIIVIVLMGSVRPSLAPAATAMIALLVTFLSASQDIVIDAYKTDILRADEIGPGAAGSILGYRIAMLVSGAIALMLAETLSWQWVYSIMAATLLLGVFGTLTAPNTETPVNAPKTLRDAVVLPFFEFFRRQGSLEVLAFLLLYKIDVVMATALMTPFMMEMGFSKTDIGAVTKGFGLIATLAGTVLGGFLMPKLGMKRSLLFFGLIQGISTLTFWALAHAGHNYPLMVASIAVENLCSGMGSAAFAAFIMSVCDHRYTASQYALLTSFMALTRVVGGAPTGFMVKALGWPGFYVFCVVIMVPGLVLLTRFERWQKPGEKKTERIQAT